MWAVLSVSEQATAQFSLTSMVSAFEFFTVRSIHHLKQQVYSDIKLAAVVQHWVTDVSLHPRVSKLMSKRVGRLAAQQVYTHTSRLFCCPKILMSHARTGLNHYGSCWLTLKIGLEKFVQVPNSFSWACTPQSVMCVRMLSVLSLSTFKNEDSVAARFEAGLENPLMLNLMPVAG